MKCLYETLGLNKTASSDEIKKAYRKLAAKFHPDRHPDNEEMVVKFKEVQVAYEILSDNGKKQFYDTHGQIPEANSPFAGQNPFGRGKPFSSSMDDFFSSMFGGQPQQQVDIGMDINIDISVTLEQVMSGEAMSLKYMKHKVCETCKGEGGIVSKCTNCNGTGCTITQGPNMVIKSACAKCNQTGKMISEACSNCHDGYTDPTEEILEFNLPQGVENQMRFVNQGLGEPSRKTNGRPGNLYITVSVQNHNVFTRGKYGSLLLVMPVTYTQLVLGDTIDVPTISDGKIGFKLPPATDISKKFKLAGMGLPIFNNSPNSSQRGDILIALSLQIPSTLEDENKKLIEQLAKVEKEFREQSPLFKLY